MTSTENDPFRFDVATPSAGKPQARALTLRTDGKARAESAAPLFWTFFLILGIGMGVIGWMAFQKSRNEAAEKAQQIENERVTFSHYEQVKKGQTYDEVKAIVGRDGRLVTSNEFSTEITGTIKTASVIWHNADGSSLQCVFQNGHLVVKTQLLLKP